MFHVSGDQALTTSHQQPLIMADDFMPSDLWQVQPSRTHPVANLTSKVPHTQSVTFKPSLMLDLTITTTAPLLRPRLRRSNRLLLLRRRVRHGQVERRDLLRRRPTPRHWRSRASPYRLLGHLGNLRPCELRSNRKPYPGGAPALHSVGELG